MKKAPTDLSPTDKVAYYLNVYGHHNPIQIISGPMGGDERAKIEAFNWKHNARAVMLALAKARQQGKRWAIAVIMIDKDIYDIDYGQHADSPGCNLETGDICTYLRTEEPTHETTSDKPQIKTI